MTFVMGVESILEQVLRDEVLARQQCVVRFTYLCLSGGIVTSMSSVVMRLAVDVLRDAGRPLAHNLAIYDYTHEMTYGF